MPALRVFTESFPGHGAYDTAISRALLEAVARGECGENLRLYQPGAVLAFSLKDRHREGFAEAVSIARAQGFEPMLRLTGGRAAVFHPETLAFAWCQPTPHERDGIHQRFDETGALLARALASLGLDARVGAVPGEYCPGEHSINLGGRIKVVGVAQRVVKGAAHVGGVVVVRDSERIRRVLTPVYRALGYEMAPASIGSLEDDAPALTRERVATALLATFEERFQLESGVLPEGIRTRAESLLPLQQVDSSVSAEGLQQARGKVLEAR